LRHRFLWSLLVRQESMMSNDWLIFLFDVLIWIQFSTLTVQGHDSSRKESVLHKNCVCLRVCVYACIRLSVCMCCSACSNAHIHNNLPFSLEIIEVVFQAEVTRVKLFYVETKFCLIKGLYFKHVTVFEIKLKVFEMKWMFEDIHELTLVRLWRNTTRHVWCMHFSVLEDTSMIDS